MLFTGPLPFRLLKPPPPWSAIHRPTSLSSPLPLHPPPQTYSPPPLPSPTAFKCHSQATFFATPIPLPTSKCPPQTEGMALIGYRATRFMQGERGKLRGVERVESARNMPHKREGQENPRVLLLSTWVMTASQGVSGGRGRREGVVPHCGTHLVGNSQGIRERADLTELRHVLVELLQAVPPLGSRRFYQTRMQRDKTMWEVNGSGTHRPKIGKYDLAWNWLRSSRHIWYIWYPTLIRLKVCQPPFPFPVPFMLVSRRAAVRAALSPLNSKCEVGLVWQSRLEFYPWSYMSTVYDNPLATHPWWCLCSLEAVSTAIYTWLRRQTDPRNWNATNKIVRPLTLTLPSLKSTFSEPFKEKCITKWGSENW